MFGFRKKSALLIDFDNVLAMTNGSLVTSIGHWMAWLEDGRFEERPRKRNYLIKRVYWNPLYDDRYRALFEAAGFEVFACAAIAKAKKSSADIVITLDAMDIASDAKGLKEIVLLTSDTDFVPVVNRLQDRDLDVVAMGNETNPTAKVYKEHADCVVLRSDFMEAFTYERPKRGWFGLHKRGPAPAPAPPAPARPKLKYKVRKADALDHAAEAVVRASRDALGAQLSRQSVRRVLEGVPGFSVTGKSPWLGYGSYKALLHAMAERRPHQLRLYRFRNGGVCIAYVAPGNVV